MHPIPIAGMLAVAFAAPCAASPSVDVSRVRMAETVAPIVAGEQAKKEPLVGGEVVVAVDWHFEDLYMEGISAQQLIDDVQVIGPGGEIIGSTEDLIVASDGRVLALIAEIGGFWDIGDTHVSIPWDEIRVDPEGVRVPVRENSIEDYLLSPDDFITATMAEDQILTEVDDVPAGAMAWRISEFISDNVRLLDTGTYRDYGYLSDVIIRDGRLVATIISPELGSGIGSYYALPYHTPGLRAGQDRQDLPYAPDELREENRFDYERLAPPDLRE